MVNGINCGLRVLTAVDPTVPQVARALKLRRALGARSLHTSSQGRKLLLATAHVLPGDILAVNTGMHFGSRMIRFGAAVRELVTGKAEPDFVNHIAFVHHIDAHGVPWGLEGRPGGVGWVDL